MEDPECFIQSASEVLMAEEGSIHIHTTQPFLVALVTVQ